MLITSFSFQFSSQEGKDKTKKKGHLDEGNSDSDFGLEDEPDKKHDVYDADDLPIYVDDSSETDDEQTVLDRSEIMKKFMDRYDKSHENCIKRRAKVMKLRRKMFVSLVITCKYFMITMTRNILVTVMNNILAEDDD